ncbi:MAG: NAD(P)/FAD-dependent oxidoreductase [Acidimicrobiales bacterium]
MTDAPFDPTFDPEAVHAKYLAERDKRLVPGRADIRDLDHDERFARYRADPFTPMVERSPIEDEVDVVILGGGIAGILAGVELRKAGVDRFRIVDTAGGLGGTWYWNRYPGVMCDVESYIYLPMLEELDYIPKHRYAFGEEILAHLQAIGDRYRLDEGALFHTGVTRAAWDEEAERWHIETDRGDRLSARYYVLAVGILNRLKLPVIEGMEDFAGHSFHSARWDYAYTGGGPGQPMTELGGKKVGLFGTGATGIQCVGPLADAAEHVYVFQRTPSAIGERGNRPTEPGFGDDFAPGWQRDRMDNFQAIMLGKQVAEDLIDDGWTHHYAVVQRPPRVAGESITDYLARAEKIDFEIMEHHRSRVAELVQDPAVAEVLKPYYRYLCKRPCFHDEYLLAFNRPNVTLVDCPAGIDRITERGPVVGGEQYDLDCLVYATGFEAELTPSTAAPTTRWWAATASPSPSAGPTAPAASTG